MSEMYWRCDRCGEFNGTTVPGFSLLIKGAFGENGSGKNVIALPPIHLCDKCFRYVNSAMQHALAPIKGESSGT